MVNNTAVEHARVRASNALAFLCNWGGKKHEPNGTLSDFAGALVEAEFLISALTILYDALYQASVATGSIGRHTENPLPPRFENNPKK